MGRNARIRAIKNSVLAFAWMQMLLSTASGQGLTLLSSASAVSASGGVAAGIQTRVFDAVVDHSPPTANGYAQVIEASSDEDPHTYAMANYNTVAGSLGNDLYSSAALTAFVIDPDVDGMADITNASTGGSASGTYQVNSPEVPLQPGEQLYLVVNLFSQTGPDETGQTATIVSPELGLTLICNEGGSTLTTPAGTDPSNGPSHSLQIPVSAGLQFTFTVQANLVLPEPFFNGGRSSQSSASVGLSVIVQ